MDVREKLDEIRKVLQLAEKMGNKSYFTIQVQVSSGLIRVAHKETGAQRFDEHIRGLFALNVKPEVIYINIHNNRSPRCDKNFTPYVIYCNEERVATAEIPLAGMSPTEAHKTLGEIQQTERQNGEMKVEVNYLKEKLLEYEEYTEELEEKVYRMRRYIRDLKTQLEDCQRNRRLEERPWYAKLDKADVMRFFEIVSARLGINPTDYMAGMGQAPPPPEGQAAPKQKPKVSFQAL